MNRSVPRSDAARSIAIVVLVSAASMAVGGCSSFDPISTPCCYCYPQEGPGIPGGGCGPDPIRSSVQRSPTLGSLQRATSLILKGRDDTSQQGSGMAY